MKYAMVAANLNGKLLDFAFKEIVLKKKSRSSEREHTVEAP